MRITATRIQLSGCRRLKQFVPILSLSALTILGTDNQICYRRRNGTSLIKMTSISSRATCHNRWCPLPDGPWNSLRCNNLLAEFETNGIPDKIFYACCKLHCEPHSQLLQLQCQGTSATIALATWVIVITLMVCAAVFVVAFPMERGFGRKVAVLGGVLFFSFTAVIAYVFGSNENLLDVPLYPIIGAMNVATFSYLFSGYQYSISFVYEIAAAATLVFTMIPVWSLLTINLSELIENTSNVGACPTDLQRRSATAAGRLAIAMLCVSIMWVVHSSLFRTIGYMAAWIGAFTLQKKEAAGSEPKKFMRRLWVLAAGDGHPTWRTPVGQAMGLYLVVLSWGVSIVSQIYLNKTCYDDLILLRMMMWFPPSLLTLVVIINQSVIFVKSTACSTADVIFPGKTWKETREFYTKAVIIYRLGRKGMDVNVDDEYNHRQVRGKRTDKALAFFVIVFEVMYFVVAYPGFRFFKLLHYLARKMIPSGTGTGRGLDCQTCECEAKMRKAAFKILCDYCEEKSILRYNLKRDGPVNADIKAEVRRLLGEHLDRIDLPLLLDNIDPSSLSYILDQLEQLVAPPSESALIVSNDQVLNSPRDQGLKTIRISKGTSFGSLRSAAEKAPQPFDSSSRSSRPTTRFAKERPGAESLLPKVELGTDDQMSVDESLATANGTSEPEITELPQPSSAPEGSPTVSLQRSDSESGSRRLFRRRASSKRVLDEEPLVE